MRICFDMDGTIANLYGVENWLQYLCDYDETPYAVAKPLINMNVLARTLNRLSKQGYEIGIISWLAKNSTNEYDEKVMQAKRKWLKKHLKSVNFDFIKIVPYGTNKNVVLESNKDILFDDEEGNRNAWKGTAYNVNNIIETLRKLY